MRDGSKKITNMEDNQLIEVRIDILSSEEMLELTGGVRVVSEGTRGINLQGWSNCCNKTEPPIKNEEIVD